MDQMTQPTVSGGKDKEVNGQGGKRGAPAPHGAHNRNDLSWFNRQVTIDTIDLFLIKLNRIATKHTKTDRN